MSARPVAHYSPVVAADPWLIVSGQVGLKDGSLVEGGVADQTTQAIANLEALLAENGAKLTDVVKTTVFMVDIENFSVVNAAYAAAFGEHRPARSAIAVAGLPVGALVEIEAWALRPEPAASS
jgi:2-iminobutanoate/2-iminopropanoate deaminase